MKQSSSEERPTKSSDLSSDASSHSRQPRPFLSSNSKYLKAVLYERHGVAALRSVADMLKKSTQDSIKAIAKYQRVIDDANRSPPWLYVIFLFGHINCLVIFLIILFVYVIVYIIDIRF